MADKKVRWGILSTGSIASTFVKALKGVPEAEVIAVGSRGLEKANAFGDLHKIPRRYGSYEDLVSDKDIDIIYIATPHNYHRDNAILCLNNNKAVLIEKAFTLNSKEAKEIADLAKSKNLFAMEAMWTRFFPGTIKVKELVKTKVIGDVHYVSGDMSFNAVLTNRNDPKGRFFNLDLAGGALLDCGIYPISYASHILDAQPVSFDTTVVKASTGVDERFTLYGKYASGAVAHIAGSFDSICNREFTIVGSLGYIRVPRFNNPVNIFVKVQDKPEEEFKFPWPENYPPSTPHNGMIYQAQAVTKCLLEGKKECELIPIQESVQIMETLDAMRARWGLKYPGEQ
eukprot:Phypoly_transcript_13215.p1 GENE.Phypoly_transcript_13215~~Phypoly_transcript_13215.p1  ORF type:complete len:342 (-),score=55.92 Phypoly_transcript_13215:36-1061(-)